MNTIPYLADVGKTLYRETNQGKTDNAQLGCPRIATSQIATSQIATSQIATRWLARSASAIAAMLFTLLAAHPLCGQKIEVERQTEFDRETYQETVQRGVEFLKESQAEDGSFSKRFGPGITALATTALIKNGVPVDSPTVQNGLSYLKSFVREDGGIHAKDSLYRNYETSLAMMCFSAANESGEYDDVIDKAESYVKELQWGVGLESDPDDPAYGGFGYGKHRRPDLSNTSFTIDALRAAGNDADSEAIQRAIKFISRTQNLHTIHNNTEFADKVGDGGFYYTPAAGGTSQAGKTENEGLRSYGSMTYAGLKSMLYAGVGKEDPRVEAAIRWIKRHYTLEENPGMSFSGPRGSYAGLYYYYHTFAKALDAYGVDEFKDASGEAHHWRAELLNKMAETQNDDGSWTNGKNERWLENDPNLVTSYVLLALHHANPGE